MVMTRGERGGDPKERQDEQRDAQRLLWAKEIYWGGFTDTVLPSQNELIQSVEEVITKVSPRMIFANYFEDTHQDHRELSRAVNSAARHISNLLYYECPTTQNFTPTVFVDIEKFIDTKLQALMAHRTQIMKTNIEGLSILEIARSLANYRGIQSRLKYAEAFMPQRLIINL
jgi:LmbE family N-acetylglucosaminyl deacetylase